MAITFHRGPQTLASEIKRAGYQIVDVTSDISDPSRSVQIWLENGVVVNWDRDSHSVWANGPERLTEKIEGYIASRRGKRRQRKTRKPSSVVSFFAMLIMVAGLLLAIVWQTVSGQHTNHSPDTTSPPAANLPDAP